MGVPGVLGVTVGVSGVSWSGMNWDGCSVYM